RERERALVRADLGTAVDIEDLDIGKQPTGGGAHRGENLRSWHVLRQDRSDVLAQRGEGDQVGVAVLLRGRCSDEQIEIQLEYRGARQVPALNERVQLTEPADLTIPHVDCGGATGVQKGLGGGGPALDRNAQRGGEPFKHALYGVQVGGGRIGGLPAWWRD